MPRAKVNGVELYYELHGTGAETVVLANGVLGSTSSWLRQTSLFSKKYRVLVYDCRNQGRSEKIAQDSTMEVHSEDLAALLTALEIESAHLVGISYGGEIGMTLALAHPHRVKSLVVSNSVSQIETALESKIEGWLRAAQLKDPKHFFQITVPDIFSESFMSQNPSFMRVIEAEYSKLDLDAVIRLIARFREFNITRYLPRIKAPTLVIASDLDTLKPVSYAERIHQQISQSELSVVKKAGHALTYEKPQEFTTLVLGFLAKQELACTG